VTRPVWTLLAAQFLSAFGDNAILFAAIAMVHAGGHAAWYVPVLQSAFLVAFVVLAPWVGPYADGRSKPRVLMLGNALKAAGALLMLAQANPVVAYALVGVGAAVYGPAKYGILPEIVGPRDLVRANGLIEGSTIVAIVVGGYAGARIADRSVPLALAVVAGCYVVSLAIALLLPATTPRPGAAGLAHFVGMMRRLFETSRARFTMLGTSLFWGAGAVLRLLLVAWVPAVLLLDSATAVAELTLFLSAGIFAGALVVAKVIPMERLRRARLAAYAMGVCILAFSQVDSVSGARIALVMIGICGGLFMVPVNAALQDIGHRSIGSGGAVALQNFFENLTMLAAVGAYAWVAGLGAPPAPTIVGVGVFVLAATFIVSWHLPPDPARIGEPGAGSGDR
jgi:LPLT family lysophospholipid transporter-like MFS transporter